MADISMCFGKECDKKDTCFRYLAKPSEYQAYIMVENSKDCNLYWKTKSKDEVEDLNKAWQD